MVLAKPSAAFTIWLVKPVPQKGKRKRDGVTLVNAASGTGNIFAVYKGGGSPRTFDLERIDERVFRDKMQ